MYHLFTLWEHQTTSSFMNFSETTEVVTGCILLKNLFLKISQNSQENTCASVYFLIELQAWGLQL